MPYGYELGFVVLGSWDCDPTENVWIGELSLMYYPPDAQLRNPRYRDTYWLNGIIRTKEEPLWVGYGSSDWGVHNKKREEIENLPISDFDLSRSFRISHNSYEKMPKGSIIAENMAAVQKWINNYIRKYHDPSYHPTVGFGDGI